MPNILSPMKTKPMRFTLNTDGKSHPVENLLSVTTLILGLVAFVAALIPAAHVVASWAGTLTLAVGFYSQYISATTPQRSLNVVGLVGGFLGVALGIYYGGYLPT